MFSLREFIKSGMLKAVGHMADYQIILNSAGWHEKGVLTEDDLAEIQTAIDAQYIVPEFEENADVAVSAETEAVPSEDGDISGSDEAESV